MSLSNHWKKDYPSVQDITEEDLDENSSLKKMLRLVGSNKRVIDFGCATGYFSQLLTKKGCRVTGVEINPEAAKVAELHCEQVIVADLDFISVTEILPIQEFDVAVFGDVLEHLRNPWKVLKETQQLLKLDGWVVASIPNIAHGAIRLALLQGRFEYTELGILDSTHLRFFTRKTVEDLFEKSDYFIDVVDCTEVPFLTDSPFLPQINKNEFSSEIWQQLEDEEGINILQFVLRAFPLSQKGKKTALNERHKIIYQLEQSQLQLQQKQAELEQSQSQLQQTQTDKEQLQSELQHNHAELEQSQLQLKQIYIEQEQLQSQLHQSQLELERSHSHLQQSQTEQEQLQSQLHQSQLELERSHSHLQQSQTEQEQLQSQLHQSQLELERSHSHLQQSQTEQEQLQSQLHQSQLELERSHSHLQQSQTEQEQLQSQLHQSQLELERSHSHLQQSQTEQEQLQSQLHQSQLEMDQLKDELRAMQTSKLWKLQTAWFKLKKISEQILTNSLKKRL